MKDGTFHELKVSEIPNGTRVRLFAKAKDQDIGGRKVRVNRIFRIDFLGRDEFSKLRSALELDPATDVSLNESGKLSATKPFKLFLVIEEDQLKQRFVNWTTGWNNHEVAKYGSIELISDFTMADAALVVLKGADSLVMTPFMLGADGNLLQFPPVTAFLVKHNADGLQVLWRQVLLTNPDSQTDKGLIEKEIAKRLKAR